MSLIDFEAAWMALKAEITQKGSHGQRDLLAAMSRIEVENQVPPGQEEFDPAPARSTRSRPATARSRAIARHG